MTNLKIFPFSFEPSSSCCPPGFLQKFAGVGLGGLKWGATFREGATCEEGCEDRTLPFSEGRVEESVCEGTTEGDAARDDSCCERRSSCSGDFWSECSWTLGDMGGLR